MLVDDSFKIPSPLAVSSRKAAVDLLSWMERPENKDKVEVFANNVVKELTGAFSSKARSQKSRREKMWGLYHSIRTSASFIGLWVKLQQSAGMDPLPTFYQHVTDQIFHDLVQQHFPVQLTESTEEANWLGHQEANAIRYVAGYVCRSLRKKITSSSSPLKQELLLALWELLEDEMAQDSDDDEPPNSLPSSSDWINSVDRGGLIHVNEEAHTMFSAIEEVVRAHLRVKNVRKISEGVKHELAGKVEKCEEVQFYWSIVATDMPVEVAEVLKKMKMDDY